MPDDSDAPYALVADDDALIRIDACDILTDAGFRPLEAAGVSEALTLLEQHADQITLLFTDVHMHGKRDGFELARITAERWPSVSIVVASGALRPKPGDLPDGAVFISKPFSAEVVHGRLLELLPEGQRPEPLKAKAAPKGN